jgi:FSR family fosmidomycin resistance protein-like MFS transporter
VTGSGRTMAGLSAAHLVIDLYGPALPAIISLLIVTAGYSYLAAGLLVTVYNAVSSLAQPGTGWIHDRKGMHVPPALSILLCGLFISLLGLAPSLGVMLLFCAIAALGHAAFHPVALALTGRMSTDANRGRIISYFVVGGNLGFALGPLAAGVAITALGQEGILLSGPSGPCPCGRPSPSRALPPEGQSGIRRDSDPRPPGFLDSRHDPRRRSVPPFHGDLRIHRVPAHPPRPKGF